MMEGEGDVDLLLGITCYNMWEVDKSIGYDMVGYDGVGLNW